MEINRRGPGEASLVRDGREILDLVQIEGSEEEFEQALAHLEDLLRPAALPRVVVQYREGLFGAVQADRPAEVVLIEEDPHDEPPLALHRHSVGADRAAVEAALAAAERRRRLAAREAAGS
ncbi:hypothetical protein EBE87_16620 [Pseudoroseomonas wenyumeiae]|uniref:Uncharacterized protein n=1 Tax=Teichococcus wenyumeiae TaxID=2478470 RepID=A0A3A9JHP2_9PROT|nr:hypothetical protein [Pseudoroseomonas wenyumeiae]RKK03104.1 hypothetical protein D6Z83_16320 [Pseudoroseomonas wenyumeiae]RMI20108.1 hypothetical protein EBE87_16620 [Pseudoroseomonas wenyumeiae]